MPIGLIAPSDWIASLEGGGRKVVASAATAEALTATKTPCVGICIQALETNTGLVCVGGSDVVAAVATRKGTVIAPGESITLNVRELKNIIYLDVTVSGDGVSWTLFK